MKKSRLPATILALVWLGGAFSTARSAPTASPKAAAAAPLEVSTLADSTLIVTLRGHLNNERWAAAESLALVMRARAEARSPVDSLLLARSLDQFAAARIGARRINDPELQPMIERALRIRELKLGPEHADLAVSLIRLAELLNAQGKCATAIPLAARGVQIREKALGAENLAVARGMTILAMAQHNCGDFEAAQHTYERTIVIREKVLGPDAAEVAVSLNNLGTALQNQGKTEAAQAVLARALAIREKTLGPEHPYVATTLGNLANLCVDRGQYAEARRLTLRSVAIREKTLGPNSADAAIGYFNLGVIGTITGDFADAAHWCRRAVEAREASLGPDHPDVAQALTNYGGLLIEIGDAEEALPLLDRALAIHRQSADGDPTLFAYALMNRALALTALGRHAEAQSPAKESVRVAERRHGRWSPSLAMFTEGLAYAMDKKGDYLDARRVLQRTLAIREKALSPTHPTLAHTYALLADLERRLGHLVTAHRLSQRALDLYREGGGGGLSGETDALGGHAMLLYQMNDRGAPAAALAADRQSLEQMRAAARTMPERQALRFAAERLTTRNLLLTIAAGDTAASITRAVWEQVIAARGVVLDEVAGRLRLANLRGAPGADSLRNNLIEASAWLAHLLTTEEPPADGGDAAAIVRQARRRREAAETALAAASAPFRRTLERAAPTLDALAAARPPGGAVVAYCRYLVEPRQATVTKPGPAAYLAFVLPAGSDVPRVVPLGSAAKIEPLVAAWRLELSGGALRSDRTPAEALAACDAAGDAVRRALWDPLLTSIGAASRVFIVPEGPLHQVNFAALPAEGVGYLVERDPMLHLLTTERDLIAPREGAPSGRGLLALGGAAFDSLGAAVAEVALSPTSGRSEVAAGGDSGGGLAASAGAAGFRGARNECAPFRDVRFPPLRGSLREITALSLAWESDGPGRSGEPLESATGRLASEETLKRSAAGHRVVHLATHGFYLGADCTGEARASREERGIGALVPSATSPTAASPRSDSRRHAPAPPEEAAARNPFHLAGVALAGANLREQAGSDREDGIVTAEELAVLDLDGVEWAVLSACDSGVGAVTEGEGIFGLRRALQIAGARTVVLALWAVRDDDTVPWITELYRAHFGRRLDTAAAAREASRLLLASRRRDGLSVHPFYWAGLLPAGGWR